MDYADDIAQRILASLAVTRPDQYRALSGRDLAALLAEAAREGYALAMGVTS